MIWVRRGESKGGAKGRPSPAPLERIKGRIPRGPGRWRYRFGFVSILR